MRIAIGKVVKELGVKPHMLHTWEERGWLGYEAVLKDPNANNQRVYSEKQYERILFIHALIQEQHERGYKRTDTAEVSQALLDEFGGEITPMKEETTLLPTTVEEFHHLLMQNNKMLGDMAEQLKKREHEEQMLQRILDSVQTLQEATRTSLDAPKGENISEKKLNNLEANFERLVNAHTLLLSDFKVMQQKNSDLERKNSDLQRTSEHFQQENEQLRKELAANAKKGWWRFGK